MMRLEPAVREPADRPMRLRDLLRADDGQGSLAALIVVLVICLCGGALAAIAAAQSAHSQRQRVAGLAAVAAGNALDEAGPRIYEPRLIEGVPNPRFLSRARLLALARAAASRTVQVNGMKAVTVGFPGAGAGVPQRVRVRVADPIEVAGRRIAASGEAEAELTVAITDFGSGASLGDEYRGPLATRQGRRMRPDVAVAFDRMQTAAGRDGFTLVINSAFRSNAEQAVLFAKHPDPKWVAPPGKSLHRLGTELDLGPPSAYRWLATNAKRFGFVQRYSWEDWHYGYVRSAGTRSVGYGPPEGRPATPGYVPKQYASVIASAAQRWNVSAALIAAQIQQESGFNPRAVSGAGAGGIAQFMPATGRAYGLSPADRYDPDKAIPAQAHLMHDLLRQFGSVPLALAAYNAGPGAVARCGCIPSFPETQRYVAAIMARLAGAGDVDGAYAGLRVRLVS